MLFKLHQVVIVITLCYLKSENDRRRRRIFIRTVVKVLMIVLVTVVGIFLYIWSDQTQRSFSIHHMIDSAVKTQNYNKFLLVTNSTAITATTEASLDVTHGAQKRKEFQMPEEDMAVTIVKELALSNHSTFEDLQTNGRSLNTDIVPETNIIRPMISDSGTSMAHGNAIKENHSSINHKNVNKMIDNDKVYKTIGITDNDRLYHTANNESEQIIHYGYSTTEASTPVAEESDSNSYYNVNDLSYNIDNYSYKKVKIPPEGIKWSTNGQSEPIHTDEFSSTGSVGGSGDGSYGQNSYYDLKSRYPTRHKIYYRPSITKPKKLNPPLKVLDEKTIPHYPISSKMDWKNIGVLSLIKLGSLKLKMIGFLQLMFLIGFKFKLFMIALFFKFILLLKLMKLFKIFILPVYIFSLLPILPSMVNRMVNMQASDGLSGSSSSGSSSFSSLTNGGFSSGGSSGGTLLPASSGSSSSGFSSGGSSGGTLLPASSGSFSGGIQLPDLIDGSSVPGSSRASSRNWNQNRKN